MSRKNTGLVVRYGEGLDQLADVAVDESVVVFRVINPAEQELARLTVDVNELPEANQTRSLLYGANKKLTDSTSEDKDKVAKLKAMGEYWELLCSGEWAKERVVGTPVVSVDVEALAKYRKLSIPATQAALAAYDKPVRASILAHKDVQAIADRIREERKATVKVASLDDMITEA